MHAFQKENEAIIKALDKCYNEIALVDNLAMDWKKNKILMDLRRHSNALKVEMGLNAEGGQALNVTQPLKKMFGKVLPGHPDKKTVTPVEKIENKPFIQTPEMIEAEDLEERVNELYNKFFMTPSVDLLQTVSPEEIKGIAIKAGVNEDAIPARMDEKFIDVVKLAIQEKAKPIKTAMEIAADELRESSTKLYTDFLNIENDQILDKYAEIEIRAVAKKAGLPVTESVPKVINIKFIEQVKDAIKKKAEIEEGGNVGNPKTDKAK